MIKNEWLDYTWKKCSLDTFYRRIKKWCSFNEAIQEWHLSKLNNWIRDYWRRCNICKRSKFNNQFSITRNICKECAKIKAKEYYEKNKDKVAIRKKKNRNKLKMKLDKIFYSDPNIKRIIQIDWKLKRYKRASKWEIQKDKFIYFRDRWYDKKMLAKVYIFNK